MSGGWDQATWKRVESIDELRSGMTLRLKRRDGEVHVLTLFSCGPGRWHTYTNHAPCLAWKCAGTQEADEMCPTIPVREGRLYSLVDTTPAEETTTATRELEKVTG